MVATATMRRSVVHHLACVGSEHCCCPQSLRGTTSRSDVHVRHQNVMSSLTGSSLTLLREVQETALAMSPTGLLSLILWCLQKADIWSSGVILYALLYGRYPFNAKEKDYAKNIVTANYAMPEDVPVSASCKELLSHVLVADPAQVSSLDLMLHTIPDEPGLWAWRTSSQSAWRPLLCFMYIVDRHHTVHVSWPTRSPRDEHGLGQKN